MAELEIVNASSLHSALAAMPLLSSPQDGRITISQLVTISSMAELATENGEAVDRVFNYLEQRFPEFIAPAGDVTGLIEGYSFRYYLGTDSYVGSRDSRVYYLGSASNNQVLDIGAFADWFSQAVAAGY